MPPRASLPQPAHRPGASLRELALAPATLRTYTTHFSRFLQHARLTQAEFQRARPRDIDTRLVAFITHLHTTGGCATYASHALHGAVFHRPQMRLHLGLACQAVRGWERSRPHASKPPMTWELAVVFAVTLARSGWHATAIALLLGFDCYLRVGELTRLRRTDIVRPNDPRMGRAHTGMALHLTHTKSGPHQWVSLQDTGVAQLLEHWLRHTAAGAAAADLVFGFTPEHFRRLIRSTAVALGVGHIPFVPHSLRYGGATADFLLGATIEQVLFRGRWMRPETARVYLQTGRARFVMQSVPQRLNRLGQRFDAQLVDLIAALMAAVPARAQHRRSTAAAAAAAPRRVHFGRL